MHYFTFKKEFIAEQFIGSFEITMQDGFPNVCRTYSNFIQYMPWNFFKPVTKLRGPFFQQFIIPKPVFAETVIISDNDSMRMKFISQEILYIIFGRLICKSIGKWNNYQVVNIQAS